MLERVSGFNFFNIFLSNAGDYLQPNPSTRTAFTLGPGRGPAPPLRLLTLRIRRDTPDSSG